MSGVTDNLPDLFMSMLKKPDEVITSLVRDIDACAKNFEAFDKLVNLYKESPEKVSTEKALTASATSIRHLNDVNRRLLMLLLTYASGTSFKTDLGMVMSKLGHGEAALQEIYRQKMGGD